MMDQKERALAFTALHQPGRPICLYNIWDAGTAQAVAKAGAEALATGSWSVAAAQGYADGEQIPLDFLLRIVERIVDSVDLPLTVDFEGGFAVEPERLEENVQKLLATGAVGINFEDRVVGGEGLYPIAPQAERIAALRRGAETAGVPLFLNARTDLFLKEQDMALHGGLVNEAAERAAAYAEAGASGFFAPGLATEELIGDLADRVSLPLNIMKKKEVPSVERLAALGVARISWGPFPYFDAMARLEDAASKSVGGTA